ncbi:MAG: DUF885 domain-containing protein [Nitrolancea sp.]
MSDAPQFTRWFDDVLAAYLRWHPVNATFIGVHENDHRLPNLSEQGLADVATEAESLIRRMETLPRETLTQSETIDRRLALGMLEIEEWEQTGDHMWRGNPSLAVGEAVFGVMSLFLRDYAPLPQRVESAIARLDAMPAMLEQARATIRSAPLAWTQRATNECEGGLAFLNVGVDQLMAEKGIDDKRLRDTAEQASAALADFRAYLRDEVRSRPTETLACGGEALDLLIRRGHQLDQTAEQMEEQAWVVLRETESRLTRMANEHGDDDWRASLRRLAHEHPTAENYDSRYGEVWVAARQAALDADLLTWPDYPIRYVPRPLWTRQAAPHLYFLFYRAPAAFDSVPIVDYLIAPLDRDASPEEQERFLRANNESVITQNHVVHHGGIGHHVQNWHAYRAESRIGKIAAVDCASRTAMLCGGTMAEGWACYASELMAETDLYSPLERLSLTHTRLRMAARAIVDVQLHTGRMTLDEAAAFYEDRTAMSAGAAHQEAVKNSMFPGAALMYLVGTDLIWNLRRELEREEGDSFNLRRVHDTFLSHGSIPVKLIADAMTSETSFHAT